MRIDLILLMVLIAIVSSTMSLDGQAAGPLEQYLDVHDRVRLEETDSVVTVMPVVAVDPDGGYLIADSRDAQVRDYAEDGSLQALIARRGGGPGEVRAPSSVSRLPSGNLAVTDFAQGLLILTPEGEELRRRRFRFRPYGATPIGRDLVLIFGRSSGMGRSPLLHLYDVERDSIIKEFFETPVTDDTRSLIHSYSWASASFRNDTIFAVYALSDTLYFYSAEGSPIGQLGLPLRHFTRPENPSAGPPNSRERMQWRKSLSRIFEVFPLSDGSWLIQYVVSDKPGLRWRLCHLAPDGEALFDVRDTPRLLAVRGDTLVLQNHVSLTPDQWILATLK